MNISEQNSKTKLTTVFTFLPQLNVLLIIKYLSEKDTLSLRQSCSEMKKKIPINYLSQIPNKCFDVFHKIYSMKDVIIRLPQVNNYYYNYSFEKEIYNKRFLMQATLLAASIQNASNKIKVLCKIAEELIKIDFTQAEYSLSIALESIQSVEDEEDQFEALCHIIEIQAKINQNDHNRHHYDYLAIQASCLEAPYYQSKFFCQIAKIQAEIKNIEQAKDLLESALKLIEDITPDVDKIHCIKEIIEIQAQFIHIEEAKKTIHVALELIPNFEDIDENDDAVQSFCMIATLQARFIEHKQAKETLQKAKFIAESRENHHYLEGLLLIIASYLEFFDSKEAISILQKMPTEYHPFVLCEIARMLFKNKHIEEANQMLSNALKIAVFQQPRALSRIIKTEAEFMSIERALFITKEMMEKGYEPSEAFSEIAKIQAQVDCKKALNIVNRIQDVKYRDEAFLVIAKIKVQEKNTEDALSIASNIEDTSIQSQALHEILVLQIQPNYKNGYGIFHQFLTNPLTSPLFKPASKKIVEEI